MYLQRINAFLIASAMIISNQLFSSDMNPMYIGDINCKFFEHGTEESNERLRCTCKVLNAAGARYHHNQTARFNEKFKNVTSVLVDTNPCWVIPSFIIFPGGKSCSFHKEHLAKSTDRQRHICDLNQLLASICYDKTKEGPFLLSNYIIGDPQRKYCISPRNIEIVTPPLQATKVPCLCLELPSKHIEICKITSEKNLKDNIYTVYSNSYTNSPYAEGTNSERYTVTFNFIPNQALIIQTEKEKCFLAKHTICPHVLQSNSAQHEYTFNNSEIFNEENIQVPEIPLEIKKSTCINTYHLKKDSLLQDMRAQKALHTLLSHGDYMLAQEVAQDVYSTDELVGFYLAEILWWHNPYGLVAKGSLQILLDKQAEKNKKMLLTNQGIIARSITTITEFAKKSFTVVPFHASDIPDTTVATLNETLYQTIEKMKTENEKPYDKYHNAVKTFVENS